MYKKNFVLYFHVLNKSMRKYAAIPRIFNFILVKQRKKNTSHDFCKKLLIIMDSLEYKDNFIITHCSKENLFHFISQVQCDNMIKMRIPDYVDYILKVSQRSKTKRETDQTYQTGILILKYQLRLNNLFRDSFDKNHIKIKCMRFIIQGVTQMRLVNA